MSCGETEYTAPSSSLPFRFGQPVVQVSCLGDDVADTPGETSFDRDGQPEQQFEGLTRESADLISKLPDDLLRKRGWKTCLPRPTSRYKSGHRFFRSHKGATL